MFSHAILCDFEANSESDSDWDHGTDTGSVLDSIMNYSAAEFGRTR